MLTAHCPEPFCSTARSLRKPWKLSSITLTRSYTSPATSSSSLVTPPNRFCLLAGKDTDSAGYHLTVADFRDNPKLSVENVWTF